MRAEQVVTQGFHAHINIIISVKNELIIDVSPREIAIAITEDDSLVELQKEQRQISFSVGDIYLGRVKKLMPGLNAAFVDVGYEKDAFLHYLDLGTNFNSVNKYLRQVISDKKTLVPMPKGCNQPEIPKEGSISDILKVGQEILVQITKEPISSKGPRLTAEISFAGRFLVLLPFADKVSISQKIRSNEERNRLKQLTNSVRPKNFGVIVRTVAEGKTVTEIDNELKTLVHRWEEALRLLQKAKLPSLVHEESGRAVAILRDLYNSSFETIHVNDNGVYLQIKEYISVIAPGKESIVKKYDGNISIFDHFGITKQIKGLFGKAVTFKRGAYLVIEHTEALHVIDVNSGNRSKSSISQEENALEVNLAAAEEVARQLRLRDMGGIIVVDFIDMHEGANRQTLYDKMRELMSKDRARHNILPLSKFGLMQITRQRVRPVMDIMTAEECPSCFGKGKIMPSILFVDQLESKIDYLVMKLKVKNFKLFVHPYVFAYINQGFFSKKWHWKFNYGFGIHVYPDQNLPMLAYRFIDSAGEEIDLKEELEIKL